MKSDKELYKIWKEYIDIPLYRVVPIRDLKSIKKNGINPAKDPYESIKPKIKELSKIIKRLEDKGIIIKVIWGRPVHGSYAIGVSLKDLNLMAVDFAPTKEDVEYYLKLRGGALVFNIYKLTNELIKNSIELSNKERKFVRELNKWSKLKVCNNVVISVKGNSRCFQNCKFQLIRRGKGGRKKVKKSIYLESPFGSFEHFKTVVKKYGLKKYMPRLRNKKFYLRVGDKISAMEIFVR